MILIQDTSTRYLLLEGLKMDIKRKFARKKVKFLNIDAIQGWNFKETKLIVFALYTFRFRGFAKFHSIAVA